MRSETDLSLQTGETFGLPLRQTDSTFLQQRYETVFRYHSFTLIIFGVYATPSQSSANLECFLFTLLSLADGSIALQGWLGVEYGVVHFLWVAIFEGVFLADV